MRIQWHLNPWNGYNRIFLVGVPLPPLSRLVMPLCEPYRIMELIIFMGIQAVGKSTFYQQRFFNTHIRINLDMLITRHREQILVNACLAAKQPLVLDNTTSPVKSVLAIFRWLRQHIFEWLAIIFNQLFLTHSSAIAGGVDYKSSQKRHRWQV